MSELTSSLPPIGDDITPQMISIINVGLTKFTSNKVATNLLARDIETGETTVIDPYVFKIDDPLVEGYIPSKIWFGTDNQLHLLYYASPTMPAGARPFGNKPCYLFARLIDESEIIDYPLEARILIDQVSMHGDMYYIFMFADEQMRNVLSTDWEGNPWAASVPEAALYTGALDVL